MSVNILFYKFKWFSVGIRISRWNLTAEYKFSKPVGSRPLCWLRACFLEWKHISYWCLSQNYNIPESYSWVKGKIKKNKSENLMWEIKILLKISETETPKYTLSNGITKLIRKAVDPTFQESGIDEIYRLGKDQLWSTLKAVLNV